MQLSQTVQTDLVLLGAGHAHLEVLRRFAMRPEPGVRLTLISREAETPYSGMLPGLIRGDYTHEQAHIDLAPLAALAGARLIFAEATAFDPVTRTITMPGRPDVLFDILSVDIGGNPAMASQRGTPVKPIGRFLGYLAQLEAELPEGAKIAIIGAGPGGVELTLALAQRFGDRLRLVLVCASTDPIPTAPPSAQRAAREALVDANVEVVFGVTAGALQNGRLALSDGSSIDADAALWATGVVGSPMLAAAGLACDQSGCIRVHPTLASVSHPQVFAAGDCATIEGKPRPKAGVWAVRAGAPLAENLRRAIRRQKLKPWKPQKHALAILGLGRGRAVAWRNGLAAHGRLVWRIKDHIDKRWMRMYSDIRMPMAETDPMRCGGCGAKVSAEVLASVLATLPEQFGPNLLDGRDDAAVVRPPAGKLLVQSVDHFRAFLDDPYVFGQIAAAHALSDIYAMGAEPWTALAIASVPYADTHRMRSDLSAMLIGATEVLRADGCTLVGGHSAEAAELALGFSVTGLVGAGAVIRKGGLSPGDRLILTKPLGTGIVLAGHMRGLTRSAWLLAAIASMRITNAEAGRIIRNFQPRAMTDITGFGLAGHLREMLNESEMAAILWADALPALPGARELAARGIESTLAAANRAWLGQVPGDALLVDPQTSGGLLVGVPANRAAACVAALQNAGLGAAEIGAIEQREATGRPIRIL